jgi:branched-chain amino acid transport system permease protein
MGKAMTYMDRERIVDTGFSITTKGKIGFSVAAVGFLFVLSLLLPNFLVFLLTEVMILGLFGMSVNLLVGYCGMVTFGHGAFYALGGYTVALLLKKTSVPFFVAFSLAPIFAAFLGLIIGFFCVRLTQFYFAMLTLAFGMLVWAIIYKWENFTGGENGIVGVVVPALISSPRAFCWFTLAILSLCSIVLWLIINSPFGYTMKAIRENPERVQFLGINLTKYRLAAVVISSFFAGISGALYTAFTRGAFPELAHWSKSGEGLIITLIGGMGTLFGPLIGSALLLVLQQIFTSVFEYWSALLGIILIVLVLFLPEGAIGLGVKMKDLRHITKLRDRLPSGLSKADSGG